MSVVHECSKTAIFYTTNCSFSVVSHCIFEETYIVIESLLHAVWNGFFSTPYIKVSVGYDCITKHV